MTDINEIFIAAIENLMQDVAREIRDKSNVPTSIGGAMPVRTGELQRSLVADVAPNEAFVSYRSPYAATVHDGGYRPDYRRRTKSGDYVTVKGHTIKAQPYLEKPMEDILKDFPNFIATSMNKTGTSLGFNVVE